MGATAKVHTVRDIRGVVYPITLVRVDLALEKKMSGKVNRRTADAPFAAANVVTLDRSKPLTRGRARF